jgi:hypothetical protein
LTDDPELGVRLLAPPEEPMGSWFRDVWHGGNRIVRSVPAGWPVAARRLVQLPLVLVAVLFLLVGWIVATLIVVSSGAARGQSARRI